MSPHQCIKSTYLHTVKRDLPQVEPELEPLREALYASYQLRKQSQGCLPVQELTDPALTDLITHRFQDLLRVVRDAQGMKGDKKHVKVPKATFRTGFDRMIRLFYDGDGAVKRLSVYVSLLLFYLFIYIIFIHLLT